MSAEPHSAASIHMQLQGVANIAQALQTLHTQCQQLTLTLATVTQAFNTLLVSSSPSNSPVVAAAAEEKQAVVPPLCVPDPETDRHLPTLNSHRRQSLIRTEHKTNTEETILLSSSSASPSPILPPLISTRSPPPLSPSSANSRPQKPHALITATSSAAATPNQIENRVTRSASDTQQYSHPSTHINKSLPTTTSSSSPVYHAAKPSLMTTQSINRRMIASSTNATGLDDEEDDNNINLYNSTITGSHSAHSSPTHSHAPTAAANSPSLTKHIFLSSPNKVSLNVGGTIFTTTLSTLQRDAATGSLFSCMFNGHFTLEPDADTGAYFIDRDPSLFIHILNYLRDGSLLLTGFSHATKQLLLREAKYYQLSGLIQLLTVDQRQTSAKLQRELSSEKEYKCVMNVSEHEMQQMIQKMTIMEGYEFEAWISAVPPHVTSGKDRGSGVGLSSVLSTVTGVATGASSNTSSGGGSGSNASNTSSHSTSGIHILFSKKLSRGELMLLDRLQTGM